MTSRKPTSVGDTSDAADTAAVIDVTDAIDVEDVLDPAEDASVRDATPAVPNPGSPGPSPTRRLPVVSTPDRSLEPVDALTAYMNQLSHHSPISREEEHELAVRWVEEADTDAARQLVLANLRLVVKIAMEYRRAWTNVLDLIQSGNVGLLEAVQRFDPYRGVKLTSYAVYWIRAYILKYIMDNYRTVRLGRSRAQRKLFFRLNKEKRQLEREGFEVEPKLLAERLEVSEADIVDMDQRMSQSDLSLNAPARRDDASAEFGDFIATEGQNAEQSFGDAELRRVFLEHVEEFVADLGERDKQIVAERILRDEPRTLQELADDFGISRERVRQLEARLIVRLRDYLKENLVDFEFYTAGD
ncbi:MAG: RNA polymerase factor sigma-32 [Myxococcota bacterium]